MHRDVPALPGTMLGAGDQRLRCPSRVSPVPRWLRDGFGTKWDRGGGGEVGRGLASTSPSLSPRRDVQLERAAGQLRGGEPVPTSLPAASLSRWLFGSAIPIAQRPAPTVAPPHGSEGLLPFLLHPLTPTLGFCLTLPQHHALHLRSIRWAGQAAPCRVAAHPCPFLLPLPRGSPVGLSRDWRSTGWCKTGPCHVVVSPFPLPDEAFGCSLHVQAVLEAQSGHPAYNGHCFWGLWGCLGGESSTPTPSLVGGDSSSLQRCHLCATLVLLLRSQNTPQQLSHAGAGCTGAAGPAPPPILTSLSGAFPGHFAFPCLQALTRGSCAHGIPCSEGKQGQAVSPSTQGAGE